MMKTILVPTDFSANAENAVNYAAGLNKKLNAKILLYHSYYTLIPATDVPLNLPDDAEIKKSAVDSVERLKNKFQKLYPEMRFDAEVTEGFTEEEIIHEEKKAKCDLVIMGTRGASGLGEMLIGSNTAAVIGKSICPVIAVPEQARMKGLNKIVFAANYGTDDFKNVYDVIDLARLFGSEVILLHVNTGDMNKTMEFAELEGFKNQIAAESKYPNISFKLLDGKDVYHGLNFYLEEIKADLLAISIRNRTFVQKIFSRSITKKMAYHSHIPVLAYHTSVQ
jgi:nucleotide-binding universal stress UspA family protein